MCFQKLSEIGHGKCRRAYRHVRKPGSKNYDQMGIIKETDELKTKHGSSIGRLSGGGGGGSSSSSNKSKMFSRMEETCLKLEYRNSPKLLFS
jgi:hypothetical protein